MEQEPTEEDAARRILKLAVSTLAVKAETSFRLHALQPDFSSQPWSEQLMKDGVKHAQLRGWLTRQLAQIDYFRLTKDGYAQALLLE